MLFFKRVNKWSKKPLSYKIRSIGFHIRQLFERLLSYLFAPVALFFKRTYIGRSIFFQLNSPNILLVAEASGLNFLVNSSDLVIGKKTFVFKYPYDFEKVVDVFSLLKHSKKYEIEKIDLLIDIGANIGTIGLTAVAKNLVYKCLAFEPEPNNYRLLEANVQINSLADRVTVHNVALSDGVATELEFELDNVNYGDHRVRVSLEQGVFNELSRRVIKVKASKLSDYQSSIDPKRSLIWMDTQGFEGYVLSGAIPLIAKQIPIVTEFWPYGLRRSDCFEKFLDALDCGSYDSFVVLDGSNVTKKYQRQALLDLAESIGWEGDHIDLLIY